MAPEVVVEGAAVTDEYDSETAIGVPNRVVDAVVRASTEVAAGRVRQRLGNGRSKTVVTTAGLAPKVL